MMDVSPVECGLTFRAKRGHHFFELVFPVLGDPLLFVLNNNAWQVTVTSWKPSRLAGPVHVCNTNWMIRHGHCCVLDEFWLLFCGQPHSGAHPLTFLHREIRLTRNEIRVDVCESHIVSWRHGLKEKPVEELG